jgi:hypothetical protein
VRTLAAKLTSRSSTYHKHIDCRLLVITGFASNHVCAAPSTSLATTTVWHRVQSANVREKEMKRQTVLELVDYVNTGTGKFTELVSEVRIGTVARVYQCTMRHADSFRQVPGKVAM